MTKKDDLDNRANQLNPNNDEYWHSRGYDERLDEGGDAKPVDGDDEN